MARTSRSVQEINGILRPDDYAAFVSDKYSTWRNSRVGWEELQRELRNYLFQTDTTTTSNNKLPWKNKTSVPKLCQLRDNLHANYLAALFPHDNWFKWEGADKDAVSREKARKIEAYMRQKIRESNFKEKISEALYDYIDSGNAFGEVSYETRVTKGQDGIERIVYAGPVLHRISPYDIYFDISASSFKDAGKVTRRIVSLGSLQASFNENPTSFAWVPAAIADRLACTQQLSGYRDSDIDKSIGTNIDGFSKLSMYYSSDMVELLEYEGDLYDKKTGKLELGRRVIVMDRRKIVYNGPMASWLGKSNKEHVCWRPRPDNLMGMGPLDNLVGMQYRLDHLENLKADVFDQIAHPVVYQRGAVEDWNWGPGERIFGDVDSSVDVLSPDTTALQADFQIENLMRLMEELAGAPRQAMGIRTPGEKTAFEVQALENAAGRIFQQKINRFEEQYVEPTLNQMLEQARRNLGGAERVATYNDDAAIIEFLSIKPEDLTQKGKLYPIGARHFAKQNQIVQNLLGFLSSAAYADPGVQVHTSGLKIAKLFEELLGLEQFALVQENIRVAETMSTQQMQGVAAESNFESIQNRQVADDAIVEAQAGVEDGA